jgi:hypothetical protein
MLLLAAPVFLFSIALLTFAASVVGTVSGFGTSTIMVPLMLIVLPYPETLLFVGIIHLFDDFWKVGLFRTGVRWKLLLWFGVPTIPLAYLGATLATGAEQDILKQMLGLLLAAYAFSLFAFPKEKLPNTKSTMVAGGAVSGFLAGLFGTGGPVRGAALAAFALSKEVYIATAGAIAIATDVTRLATYWSAGTSLNALLAWGLIVFIPVSFLGALFGRRLVQRISQERFRQVVAVFLLLVGLKLFLFPS